MRPHLKRIDQQVMVITGATSGIGLATARLAASKGARVVLAARNRKALEEIVDEIEFQGGEAHAVVADVGREGDVERIADEAIDHFGGFDTWVNNAGVSIYGRIVDVPTADLRRLFETNYWGIVYGSIVAARHLRHRGGAILNLGSALSDRSLIYQGTYSATKHAVKAFTDALRMEIEADGWPISVTLVKPAGIDTPYYEHAENYLDEAAALPPPVYAPSTVAEAIIHCAQHPKRDVLVGAAARMASVVQNVAPGLTDTFMSWFGKEMQMTDDEQQEQKSALWEPGHDGKERGSHDHFILNSSLYTKATLHPIMTGLVVLGAGLAGAALLGAIQRWRATSPEFADEFERYPALAPETAVIREGVEFSRFEGGGPFRR